MLDDRIQVTIDNVRIFVKEVMGGREFSKEEFDDFVAEQKLIGDIDININCSIASKFTVNVYMLKLAVANRLHAKFDSHMNKLKSIHYEWHMYVSAAEGNRNWRIPSVPWYNYSQSMLIDLFDVINDLEAILIEERRLGLYQPEIVTLPQSF